MKLVPVKLIPVVAGVILGAGGLIGGAYAGGLLPPGAQRGAEPPAETHVEVHGMLYPTRERIVNLADTGILRYLKVTLVLEVFDPENPKGEAKGGEEKKGKEELPKDLRPKLPVMEDRITAILSARTATELMSADGKQRLKDDLRDGLNQVLQEDRILAVYFTDFIIQ
jgi:flagellar FliL protein